MNPTAVDPRFVMVLPMTQEQFPELAELDPEGTVIWDRQEKKPVVTFHRGYQNLICLETTRQPGDAPFSELEDWLNRLDNDALESEGVPATQSPIVDRKS